MQLKLGGHRGDAGSDRGDAAPHPPGWMEPRGPTTCCEGVDSTGPCVLHQYSTTGKQLDSVSSR